MCKFRHTAGPCWHPYCEITEPCEDKIHLRGLGSFCLKNPFFTDLLTGYYTLRAEDLKQYMPSEQDATDGDVEAPSCMICGEDFVVHDHTKDGGCNPIRLNNCGHLVGQTCMQTWALSQIHDLKCKSASCPKCRAGVNLGRCEADACGALMDVKHWSWDMTTENGCIFCRLGANPIAGARAIVDRILSQLDHWEDQHYEIGKRYRRVAPLYDDLEPMAAGIIYNTDHYPTGKSADYHYTKLINTYFDSFHDVRRAANRAMYLITEDWRRGFDEDSLYFRAPISYETQVKLGTAIKHLVLVKRRICMLAEQVGGMEKQVRNRKEKDVNRRQQTSAFESMESIEEKEEGYWSQWGFWTEWEYESYCRLHELAEYHGEGYEC